MPFFSRKRTSEEEPAADRRGMIDGVYQADAFTLDMREGWYDRTAFVIEGPHEHDLQHTLTINVDDTVGAIPLIEYATVQLQTQVDTLRGCRLLREGHTRLQDETVAYQATFMWYPTDERRLYQEQLMAVHEGMGYKLTATFTKKTRKTLGPAVMRAMRSFQPGVAEEPPAPRPSSAPTADIHPHRS